MLLAVVLLKRAGAHSVVSEAALEEIFLFHQQQEEDNHLFSSSWVLASFMLVSAVQSLG